MFTLDELRPHLLTPEISESEIIKELELISNNFTINRDRHLTDYTYQEKSVSAYTMFYLPTNALKLKYLLDLLPYDVNESIKNTTVYDIGCGPGTYTWAFKRYFDNDIQVVPVDQSSLMREQVKKIARGIFQEKNFNIFSSTDEIPAGRNSTLFWGNSLNEMGFDKSIHLANTIKPQFLIWIEPGTKEVFHQYKSVRHLYEEIGYKPVFPCLNVGSCPINDDHDWCHQTLKVKLSSDIERLSQLIKKDRKTMPLMSHVYKRSQPGLKNEDSNCENRPQEFTLNALSGFKNARLIRLKKELKYAFVWQVCLEGNNGELNLVDFEIPLKQFSKSQIKKIKEISTGLKIEYSVTKKISSTLWRVTIANLGFN